MAHTFYLARLIEKASYRHCLSSQLLCIRTYIHLKRLCISIEPVTSTYQWHKRYKILQVCTYKILANHAWRQVLPNRLATIPTYFIKSSYYSIFSRRKHYCVVVSRTRCGRTDGLKEWVLVDETSDYYD